VACCDQKCWWVQEFLHQTCRQEDHVGRRSLWSRKGKACRDGRYFWITVTSITVTSVCRMWFLQCLYFPDGNAQDKARVKMYTKDMLVCTCQVPMLANLFSLAVPCQHLYGTDFDHSCTARRVLYTWLDTGLYPAEMAYNATSSPANSRTHARVCSARHR